MVRPLALSVLLVLPSPSSIVPSRRIRSAHSPCAYILCRASGHLGSSLRDVVVYGFGTIDDTRGAMNRTEALRILGLDNDATADDIKAAYKETAQILHPDRFAGNKKLQDRATEQFKNLQEAYEYLTKGRGSRASSRSGSGSGASHARPRTVASDLEARLAGIAAARTQLVKQRDAVYDERRNGIAMAAIGGLVALFAGRRPVGILGIVAAIATAAAVWGIVQVVSSQRTIATLDEHIAALNKEERRLSQELDDEE